MNSRVARFTAALLMSSLIVPVAFLTSPQLALAQGVPSFETNPAVYVNTTISAIKQTLSTALDITNTAANVADKINTWVLMPLAFVMSGQLLKMITASVLGFVAGALNGTGAPQFVQNLQGHLTRVGDTQAYAFFVQFNKNSNSPFSAAITSSLRTNYLQQTSLAGFFAANRSTLPQYAANPNAFLAGNWSQGGVRAWFALTTQDQNNPYILQQNSQNKLRDMVDSAVAAREQMLAWGQGFLSWCPSGSINVAENPIAQVECIDHEDGLPVDAQTPGTTIKSFLDRTLGSTFGKLESLGQLGPQVNGILGNIAKVMSTIALAQNILGGSSGGLSGVIQGGPGGTATYLQYRNEPGFLGVTQQSVAQSAATILADSDSLTILSEYEKSWNTIRGTAITASSSVATLAARCETAASTNPETLSESGIDVTAYLSASRAQANAARSTLSTVIAPVFTRTGNAAALAAAKRAKIAEAQSSTDTKTIDAITSLQTMPPTAQELGQAQQDATSLGGAKAIPPGSLNVSGGSLLDQMNLIATNATALTSVCEPQTYSPSFGGGSD